MLPLKKCKRSKHANKSEVEEIKKTRAKYMQLIRNEL